MRFIEGHTIYQRTAPPMEIDALAGAGAIRSTADDMLTYLEANLHPEKIAARNSSVTPQSRTLSAALAKSHELQSDAGPGVRIGFAWLHDSASGDYWHNGGTLGYTSYVFFNPKGNYAAVVLLNTSIGGLGSRGSLADMVGRHISQRMAGKPAISLAN